MGFDPPSRAAGHSPPHPELIQFLKGKNLDDQLETLLQMSETDLAKMADEHGCDSGEGEQLEKLLKQERDRREREPSVGVRLAEELKKSGAQTDGKKVHVPVELRGETFHVSQEHRWATRVHEAQFPQEFVDQRVTKDTVILLLGDHASKQTLINLMLNYNVGMKLRERRLEMDVDQGTMVHSAMAAFKIPAILGGRLQSRLTLVNAPDFDKVGMDGLIANQVEEFLARHIDSISGVCCLVEGNKDTPEAYKDAFNAVLKQLGQGIAELTILCIMSGEGSEVDEKRLQKIQNSMRKAGVLYRRAAYFKCPELHEIESAAASLAWQSISDNFAEFFTSLSGNFTLKQEAEEKRERTFTTMKVDMAWRPFGSWAGERTRLFLKNAPEAFDPAQEICLKFTDRQEYVTAVKRPMERDAGVQLYVLDLQCESRIPTGDLNATLVTSEEECSFSGEMTLPGKATFKLPFDDKHWYRIKAFDGSFMEVLDDCRDPDDPPNREWNNDQKFRFFDTGEGNREFKIYLRHCSDRAVTNSDRAVTNHSGCPWHLVQHNTVQPNDGWQICQIWTVEKAGSSYVIKSKKDGKVIIRTNETHEVVSNCYLMVYVEFTVQDASGDDREKFTFRQMSRI